MRFPAYLKGICFQCFDGRLVDGILFYKQVFSFREFGRIVELSETKIPSLSL